MVASTSPGSVPASTSSKLVGGVGCSRARDCTRLRAASTAQAANGREAASSARGTPTSSRTTVLDRSSDAVVASPAASAATSSVTWVGQPIAEPSVPASSRPAEATVRRTTVAAVAGTSIRLRTPGEPREQDGDQDDRPIGRVDPERGDLRQGEDVGDDGQQQDTQERAEHRAPPAVEAHPADHGRGEGAEDEVGALGRGDCGGASHQGQASDGGEDGGNDEDADQDPVHVDACGPGGLAVPPDDVEAPADPVEAQEQGGEDEDEAADQHRHRDGEDLCAAQPQETLGKLEERPSTDQPQRQSTQQDEHCQGDDESVEPKSDDQRTVDEPDHDRH